METLPQPQPVELWKAAINDPQSVIEHATTLLTSQEIPYCVIGGQAVSSYVEPVVSLDLDLVIPGEHWPKAEYLLQSNFQVRRFSPFLSVSLGNSDFRIQVHSKPHYEGFVERAAPRNVLGLMLPVADLRDVFMSKLWAAQDTTRRASKRQKDLADIARILEVYPHLSELVPEEIKARMY